MLFDLHGEMGNKWSLIALKLPGRYGVFYAGPTIALKITSTPNYARPHGN